MRLREFHLKSSDFQQQNKVNKMEFSRKLPVIQVRFNPDELNWDLDTFSGGSGSSTDRARVQSVDFIQQIGKKSVTPF